MRNLGISLASVNSLGPIPNALIEKSKKILLEAGYEPSADEQSDMETFCLLISQLDPKAVTATRIPIAYHPQVPRTVSYIKLTQDLPIFECEYPGANTDIASLALLKVCVSRFGPRGESTLRKIGLATNPEVRALWCENLNISSRASESETPHAYPLIELQCQLGDSGTLEELVHRLNQIGAKRIWTYPVQDRAKNPKTSLTLICSETDKPDLIETLLILGQAEQVQTRQIEQHALQKKTVSVTLGKQQKLKVCRVVEFLWGDKILRAEPLLEDLTSISQSTGQLQEIVRADVLAAWKKKCGQ